MEEMKEALASGYHFFCISFHLHRYHCEQGSVHSVIFSLRYSFNSDSIYIFHLIALLAFIYLLRSNNFIILIFTLFITFTSLELLSSSSARMNVQHNKFVRPP